MTIKEFEIINERIAEYMATGRLSMALSELKSMAELAKAPWAMREQASKLCEDYSLLRKYAIEGAQDPSRKQLLKAIRSGIQSVSAGILRHICAEDSPKIYFSNLRYERTQSDSNIPLLIDRYREECSRLSLIRYSGKNPYAMPSNLAKAESLEQLEKRIFNLVWVSYPLTSDLETSLYQAITDKTLPLYFRQHLVSAVLLGAIEYFDERRQVLLARVYQSETPGVEHRALVALLVAMWMNRQMAPGNRLSEALDSLAEMNRWSDDVQNTFLKLLRTLDTERINRTMNDEIIPEIMKMRPEIQRRMDKANPKSIEDIDLSDINPDWEDLFESSGLSSKLQELSELQTEGADVMMSTFSHLKGFAFFNDVANWFLPFYADYSATAKILGADMAKVADMVASSPALCDSDKYSLVMSMENIPASARSMMISQLEAQQDNLDEAQRAELLPERRRREIDINLYIHDLYRFFTLYRRKGEFRNPFASHINLIAMPEFDKVFDDDSSLEAVADFYFKRKYFAEALSVFGVIVDKGYQSSHLYQKIGFCYQKQGDTAKAIEYYERAEMLDPDSKWVKKHLGSCYKSMGDYKKAADCYRYLSEAEPDNLNVALSLGYVLMKQGDYAGALKQYFKVEFLEDGAKRALRPLAWCLMLAGDYEKSLTYYKRIIDNAPSADDYLNAGHLRLITGHIDDAVSLYRKSVALSYDAAFARSMTADRSMVLAAGVDPDIYALALDASLDLDV